MGYFCLSSLDWQDYKLLTSDSSCQSTLEDHSRRFSDSRTRGPCNLPGTTSLCGLDHLVHTLWDEDTFYHWTTSFLDAGKIFQTLFRALSVRHCVRCLGNSKNGRKSHVSASCMSFRFYRRLEASRIHSVLILGGAIVFSNESFDSSHTPRLLPAMCEGKH